MKRKHQLNELRINISLIMFAHRFVSVVLIIILSYYLLLIFDCFFAVFSFVFCLVSDERR